MSEKKEWGYLDHSSIEQKQKTLKIAVQNLINRPVLLAGVTGSLMWGLARPDSDIDVRGVYADSLDRLLSLHPEKDTIEDMGDIDIQFYELKKACEMLLAYNGNLVELMLSPTVFMMTKPGEEFREIAREFLTRRLSKYYAGYAHSQRARAAKNRGGKALVYCVVPGHKVLTDDLVWTNVENLSTGQGLVGFSKDGIRQKWQRSEVISNDIEIGDVYEIALSDGTKLQATGEHPWLITQDNTYVWRQTKKLKVKTRLKRLLPVWKSDTSFDAGWLSGFLDGEGALHHGYKNHRNLSVSISQNEGPELWRAKNILRGLDFQFYEQKSTEDQQRKLFILGGKKESLRLLGQIRPGRLLRNLNLNIIGGIRGKPNSDLHVVGIKHLGKREIVAMSTSTETYLVEGFGSHNTYREMFAGIGLMRWGYIEYNFRTLWKRIEEEKIYTSPFLRRIFERSKWETVGEEEMRTFWDEWEVLKEILYAEAEKSSLPSHFEEDYDTLNTFLLRQRGL